LKQSDIIAIIKNMIDQFDIPHELVELELTENIVFQDADRSFDDLFELKALGVSLAMDDFGSGFSTLRHLAHIPFDRIKIDKKLISNIHNPKDAAIVSGIISICNDLGLEVIAEGVETVQQLDFCLSKNCNCFQGWYYYPAVDPSEITKFLTQGVPWKDKLK
jgi:EAL domain-containing protein (putative c-di-GMP-specific phosphodiesterase class I)